MSDVRDDISKAIEEHGLTVAGGAAGLLLGRKIAKGLYRGKAKVKGPHGTQSFGIQPAGKQRPGDVNRGWISADSPLGRGLKGKRPGDTVKIGSSRYEVIRMQDNSYLLRPLVLGAGGAGAAGGAAINQRRKK